MVQYRSIFCQRRISMMSGYGIYLYVWFKIEVRLWAFPVGGGFNDVRISNICKVSSILTPVSLLPWMRKEVYQDSNQKGISQISQIKSYRTSLENDITSILREGWCLQNGWIFGKVPKGGEGVISNPKIYVADFGT